MFRPAMFGADPAERFRLSSVVGPRSTVGCDATRDHNMAWTTPVLIEICIGLEINGYLPPEF